MSIPSFKGKHNAVKTKIYLVLREAHFRLSSASLSTLTGIPESSLRVTLLKLHRWGRIKRQKVNGFYLYSLGEKGLQWLVKWQELIPIQRYRAEMVESRNLRRERK